jgi:CRP-like cAMP-binding protein
MLTRRVLLGRSIAPLTAAERARLEGAISEVRPIAARSTLVHKGEALEHSTLLLRGFLSRHTDDRRGHRQLVSLHVPGDLVDLHAFPMKQLDHDVAALTDAEVAILPHPAIKAVTEADPGLARKLWFATLLDSAMHRAWIFRLGRLDASGRVSHFFAETGSRLQAVGLGTLRRFPLPLTQADVGDACGMTSVHVSRVLKFLRDNGICTFREGEVIVADQAGLFKSAQFDPSYLYLDAAVVTPPERAFCPSLHSPARPGAGDKRLNLS